LPGGTEESKIKIRIASGPGRDSKGASPECKVRSIAASDVLLGIALLSEFFISKPKAKLSEIDRRG
jgi:hypothetical protein